MTIPNSSPESRNLSLPFVGEATIDQVEHSAVDFQALYDELFNSNEKLALWLRRKAQAIAPNPDNREAVARLVLEALAITKNQIIIDGLQHLFEAESSDEEIAGLPSAEILDKGVPPAA